MNLILIFKKIRKNYSSFSKTHKKIAGSILNDYKGFAFSTLEKLSQELGVSEASIYRFARELGYDGFTSFKDDLQDYIKDEIFPMRELKESIETNIDHENILYNTIESSICNLNNIYSENLYEKYLRTIEEMQKAKNIYVFALRSSFSLSYYFSFTLNQLKDNVRLLNLCYGNIYDNIKDISGNDVYFTISYPPYTEKSIEMINYAKDSGAFTIAISDSFNSPLFTNSDLSIKIEPGSTYSFVPTMIFLNSIVIAIGKKDKAKSLENIDHKTKHLFERGVYYHDKD